MVGEHRIQPVTAPEYVVFEQRKQGGGYCWPEAEMVTGVRRIRDRWWWWLVVIDWCHGGEVTRRTREEGRLAVAARVVGHLYQPTMGGGFILTGVTAVEPGGGWRRISEGKKGRWMSVLILQVEGGKLGVAGDEWREVGWSEPPDRKPARLGVPGVC
jgi:hypothetical protein